MRHHRQMSAVLWNIVLVFCVLALIVTLVALGAGMMALITIIAILLILASSPFRGQHLAVVAVGQARRSPPSRAPPID